MKPQEAPEPLASISDASFRQRIAFSTVELKHFLKQESLFPDSLLQTTM